MQIDRLKRREFLQLLAVAIVPSICSRAASAQQTDRVRRIGLLFGLDENDELGQSYVAVFRQRLQELGWTDGRNIHIDYRWGGR